MGIYIRTDLSRLTFRELWRIHPRIPVFLAACLTKVLGWRTPLQSAALHEEVIRVIPAEHVPAAAVPALGPEVEEFQRLGATLAFYHTASGTPPLQGCAAVLLSPDRNAVMTAAWASAKVSGPGSEVVRAIISQLQDGTFLATGGNRPRFDPVSGVTAFHYPGATPAELLERHRQHLSEAVVPPLPVENTGQAEQVLLAIKRHSFEGNVRRGIWVPLTQEELERLGLPLTEVR